MSTEQTNNDLVDTGQTGSEKTRGGARRWLGIGAAVVALAVGSLVVSTLSPFGLAGAQDNGSPVSQLQSPTTVDADQDADTEGQDAENGEEDCDGRRGHRGKLKGGADRLAPVAEALDMEVDEVVEALRNGQTIAELAGDQADEVIAALVQHMTDQIQAKVDDGSIDQDKADEMIAGLEEKVTAFVNGERPDGSEKGHKRGKGPRGSGGFKDGSNAGAAAEKTAA